MYNLLDVNMLKEKLLENPQIFSSNESELTQILHNFVCSQNLLGASVTIVSLLHVNFGGETAEWRIMDDMKPLPSPANVFYIRHKAMGLEDEMMSRITC